jgi:hypothetical protein
MPSFDTHQAAYRTFPDQFRSLMLATVSASASADDSAQRLPQASYAPFIQDDDRNFYIYVSGLADHTANLQATGLASILLIEDEAQTPQIFARRRLSYTCRATLIPRDTPAWETLITQFESRFGALINTLRGLADFQLFQLKPCAGRFVAGFGAAYAVNPENLNELIAPNN